MEKELFKLASTEGVFASLFVLLFLYTIWDSRTRESKYQETIHENQSIIKQLSSKFDVVDDIKNDVKEIRDEIRR